MKRTTISLSDTTWEQLNALGEVGQNNVSLVVEVALKRLFLDPPAVRDAILRRAHLDRRASSRSGWARAFWQVLSELLGYPLYDPERTLGPRHYGNFQVVLLMNHFDRPDDEDDPFVPYIAPYPATQNSPAPYQWDFRRSSSPVEAAELVAAKLQELGVIVPPA